MVVEALSTWITVGVGIGTLASTAFFGVKWIFSRGKQAGLDKACGLRIEGKISEIAQWHQDHQIKDDEEFGHIKTKLDTTKATIMAISNDVSFIKGQLEQHFKTSPQS